MLIIRSVVLPSFKANYLNIARLLCSFPGQIESKEVNHSEITSNRSVPLSEGAQNEIMKTPAEHVLDAKLLQIAILGVPNAGKSTLVNQLTSWRVCAVSKKVHTTRKNAKTVYIEGNTQLVFFDTPGLVSAQESKKHSLETAFVTHPERALLQSDLIVVLHDISNKFTQSTLSPKILRLLNYYPEKKSILVLNKVDELKDKRPILDYMSILTKGVLNGKPLPPRRKQAKSQNRLTVQEMLEKISQKQQVSIKNVEQVAQDEIGWPNFSTVFMISALTGDGIPELKDYLLRTARPAPWLYHSSMVTDQTPYELAMSAVREKLLDHLPHEVPYNLKLDVEHWDYTVAGVLNLIMQVKCPTEHIAKIVVGASGSRVRQLAQEGEQSLRDIFRTDVRLRLNVLPQPSSPPKNPLTRHY